MKYITINWLRVQVFESEYDLVRYYWADLGCKAYYENIRVLDFYTRQPVSIDIFLNLYYKIREERYRKSWAKRKYTFRKGPVPRTGKRNYRGGYRHPRTKQERSQEVPTRAKRNYIPTSWDDIYVRSEKNWKSQRKTQWKATD